MGSLVLFLKLFLGARAHFADHFNFGASCICLTFDFCILTETTSSAAAAMHESVS